MGARIRVVQHSGRSGSASHNDRSFLRGKTEEERAAMAPHIRSDAERPNRLFRIAGFEEGDLKDAELAFYRQRYGEAVEAINARYRAEGHPERCGSIEKLYGGKLTRPEEMILQLGGRDDAIDPQDFEKAIELYLKRLEKWNSEHGGHMHLLSVAIHQDESSPHAHIRRVWDYTDKFGYTRLGQNKALEAAGVALPDPSKPAGRYNNRKMTFDAMTRGMWQDVARELGLEVETEARPGMRHKDKAEFIADRIREDLDRLSDERDRAAEDAERARRQAAIEAEALQDARERRQSAERALERIEHTLNEINVSGGLLESHRLHKPLFGQEHIRISPQEAAAADAAIAISAPIKEAQQRAAELVAAANDEAAHIVKEAKARADAQFTDKLFLENTLGLIRDEHPELFDESGVYMNQSRRHRSNDEREHYLSHD